MIAARRHALPPDVEARHQIGVQLRHAREAARLQGRAQSPALRREIGAALKAARDAAGMSQSFVARRLGISTPMVCFFETGQKRVPLNRRDDVAAVYGVPPEHLDRPPIVTRSEDEAALVTGYRHLSEDERAALLALVQS